MAFGARLGALVEAFGYDALRRAVVLAGALRAVVDLAAFLPGDAARFVGGVAFLMDLGLSDKAAARMLALRASTRSMTLAGFSPSTARTIS